MSGEHDLSRQRPARKRFGQNFLTDPHVIERITKTIAPAKGELLIEIGPGRAAITEALLARGARLLVVELDRDLVADLQKRFAGHAALRIISADALQTDFAALAEGQPYRLFGNLPYNISSPLLFHALDQQPPPGTMHFMLQKEVVMRMAAAPGSKRFGRLSVMCQNRCRVTPLFEIKPDAFVPRPKVDSAFVQLEPLDQPMSGEALMPALDVVVRQAFSKRRKTLRNSMSGVLDHHAIEAAGIDPRVRAEQLSLTQFIELARQLPDTTVTP